MSRAERSLELGPDTSDLSVDDVDNYPPAKYRTRLGCPFAKHYPKRYEAVDTPCTRRWGFKNIGSLNEHIKRQHLSKNACVFCKSGARNVCDHSKVPEWMDEEQEARYKLWAKRGSSQASDTEKWTWIYQCLWPEATDIPSPYYDYLRPSHRDPAPSVESPVPSAQNEDNGISILEGITPYTWGNGSSGDPRALKRARVHDTYIEYEDSQAISGRITNFAVSSGGAFSGDSGVSLTYDLDQDDLDRLRMDKALSSPLANLDPALLNMMGTEFSSDEKLEWNGNGEIDDDHSTRDEQETVLN